ncbi:MAG: hypothetical protein OEV78_07320 [Spirochaetia bacterium]|nr:hypothetical protein [Spirochaetia bacterium]
MKHEVNKDHFPSVIENLIIITIVLVIGHTIIEDLGAVYNWSHKTMTAIMIAGFLFDLFFTMEFIARSLISKKNNEFGFYIKYQRGWVDALSSIPLLLLVSGPAMFMLLSGSESESIGFGFFSILKTAKAIRVTRILRLIRVLKLFGKIQNTDSNMTNRHMGSISTISVVTLVMVLVITQYMPFARVGDHDEYLAERTKEINTMLSSTGENANMNEWLKSYVSRSKINSDIIELKTKDGEILFSNPNEENLRNKSYNQGKPIKLANGYEVILSYYPADALHAKSNMIIFLSILGCIFSFMFIYSRIFVQQITDPIYVMTKGFRNWDYNLAVKESDNYSSDEVFELAKTYNQKWLPLKNQIRAFRQKKSGAQEKSSIKMDDVF